MPLYGQTFHLYSTNIISFFYKNSLNQFYIRICVQLFNLMFFSLNHYWSVYYFKPLKSDYHAYWGICRCNCQWIPLKTVILTMKEVQNNQISNTQGLSSFENIVNIENFLSLKSLPRNILYISPYINRVHIS